eukprot:scaffold168696_cov32-Prasinocladus_malaysianus.AAC.2
MYVYLCSDSEAVGSVERREMAGLPPLDMEPVVVNATSAAEDQAERHQDLMAARAKQFVIDRVRDNKKAGLGGVLAIKISTPDMRPAMGGKSILRLCKAYELRLTWIHTNVSFIIETNV